MEMKEKSREETIMSKYIPVTTIAKYTVCPSHVYSDLVLGKKIYEFTDAMNLGQYYHDVRCRFNDQINRNIANTSFEKERLFRDSIYKTFHYAEISNFSSSLVDYVKTLDNRIHEEITKHDKFPLLESEFSLQSETRNLAGRLDALVDYNNSAIPWDYKTHNDPIFYEYNEIQILLYCLLLEENNYICNYKKPKFGIIDYVDIGQQKQVEFNSSNRKRILTLLDTIDKMIITKDIPSLFQCKYYQYDGNCIHCSNLSCEVSA
jgi:CRISPR/Cas system-associated exonuclease Cas4 (RecB family)